MLNVVTIFHSDIDETKVFVYLKCIQSRLICKNSLRPPNSSAGYQMAETKQIAAMASMWERRQKAVRSFAIDMAKMDGQILVISKRISHGQMQSRCVSKLRKLENVDWTNTQSMPQYQDAITAKIVFEDCWVIIQRYCHSSMHQHSGTTIWSGIMLKLLKTDGRVRQVLGDHSRHWKCI